MASIAEVPVRLIQPHPGNASSKIKIRDAHVVSATENPEAEQDGRSYWSNHCLPVLSYLLQNIGTYTPEEQASHLRFAEEFVIPNMSYPAPDKTRSASLLAANGSPFETSINFSGAGKPCLRFIFEPLMPGRGTLSESPIPRIAEAVGADTRWLEQFAPEYFLANEEVEGVKDKFASNTARIPRCYLAFDLIGDKRSMKAYFSPVLKNMASGRNTDEITLNLIKRLDPSFGPALDFIQEFKAISQGDEPPLILVAAIDCVAPDAGARVKLYTATPSNSFNTVREYVTFGGRLTDKTTFEGLKVLREIWHLLLNEQDESRVDDSFSKPVADPNSGHKGLCFSWEIRPGQDVPETKVYVPLFQYSTSTHVITRNLEQVFKKHGWSLGFDGKFEKLVEEAFGHDVASATDTITSTLLHTYISFTFSEKKGAYITTYLAPPLQFD